MRNEELGIRNLFRRREDENTRRREYKTISIGEARWARWAEWAEMGERKEKKYK